MKKQLTPLLVALLPALAYADAAVFSSSLGVTHEGEVDDSWVVVEDKKPFAGFSQQDIKIQSIIAQLTYSSQDISRDCAEAEEIKPQQPEPSTYEGLEALEMLGRFQLGQKSVVAFHSAAEHSGLFIVNSDDSIIISYRGSYTARNWASDFCLVGVPTSFTQGYVHAGFYYGFLSSWDSLKALLDKEAARQGVEIKDLDITVNGHSLGGALALLGAYRLCKEFGNETVKLITFASPRAVSIEAAEECEKLFGHRALRVIQEGDPIPAFPLELGAGFHHVGDPLRIAGSAQHLPHLMSGYHSVIGGLDFQKIAPAATLRKSDKGRLHDVNRSLHLKASHAVRSVKKWGSGLASRWFGGASNSPSNLSKLEGKNGNQPLAR